MASPRIFTDRGFTLIEILIVLGIMAIISSFSLVLSLDSYRGYAFRNDRDLLVSAIEKARNQAMNSVCLGAFCSQGKSHGVHIDGKNFVVFQTDSDYGGRDFLVDEIIQAGSSATEVSGTENVVFERLSGKAIVDPVGSSMVISDGAGKNSTIEFNSQGQIKWTN